MLRAGQRTLAHARWTQTSLYRPASHRYIPKSRTMATSAAIQAERFFADRAAPICSLEIAKSFALLRYVQSTDNQTL